MFYFYITDSNNTDYKYSGMRLKIENDVATFDLISALYLVTSSVTVTGSVSLSEMRDYMSHDYTIVRRLAKLTKDDLSRKYNITVPAGTFDKCVRCVVNIYGDGTYLSSGTYPIETYLAPGIGIVKAIGKDQNGSTLYTLKLIQFNE